jgi:hypothetical protein
VTICATFHLVQAGTVLLNKLAQAKLRHMQAGINARKGGGKKIE